MTKQELIEQKIDDKTSGMVAMIALASRATVSEWKATGFIKGFANSMGLYFAKDLLYIDIAVRIINYLYPKNRAYWHLQDKRYQEQYNNSCLPGLVKYNNKRR